MDIRNHQSFGDNSSLDTLPSVSHKSAILTRDEKSLYSMPKPRSSERTRNPSHNKSADENAFHHNFANHLSCLKAMGERNQLHNSNVRARRTKTPEMMNKENLSLSHNTSKLSSKKGAEKAENTDIMEKYKNLLKAYEQLVKLNVKKDEAIRVEKIKYEEQKGYIDTLKSIIEEGIAKAGLLNFFKKSFNHVNVSKADMYEQFFDVVELHRRLQDANQIREELENEVEIVKNQAKEMLKRKEKLHVEINEYQEMNESLKEEFQRVIKVLENMKREKEEMAQEKRSLVEYLEILKGGLGHKGESEVKMLEEKLEEMYSEYNELKKLNMDLEDEREELAKHLQEKDQILENMNVEKESMLLYLREREAHIAQKDKQEIVRKQECITVHAKVDEMQEELEKERGIKERLEIEMNHQVEEIVKLKREIQNFKAQEGLKEGLEGELRRIEDEREALASENKQMREDLVILQKASISPKAEELILRKDAEKHAEEMLEEQNKLVRIYLEQIRAELNNVVHVLEAKDLVEVEEEIEGREEVEYEGIKEEFEDILKKAQNISQEVEWLKEQYRKTKQSLVNEMERIGGLEINKDELEKRIEQLTKSLGEITRQKDRLLKVNETLASGINKKEQEMKRLRENTGVGFKMEANQVAINCFKTFVFNPEVIEVVEEITKTYEEMRGIETKLKMGKDQAEENMENIPEEPIELEEKMGELKRRSDALHSQLYELKLHEEDRYNALYQLERQNTQLKDELNEFVASFGEPEKREVEDSDKKSVAREPERGHISQLFADFRMPMTKINFDFE